MTALVVGGINGAIGKAISAALKSDGHRVIPTWCGKAPSPSTATEYAESPRLDVRQFEQASALIQELDASFDGIDVMIYAAGIFRKTPLPLTSETVWTEMIDVNLNGVFRVCKIMSAAMMRRQSGQIIIIGSAISNLPQAGESAYAASKAGVASFARALARDVAPCGVRVHVILPGFISSHLNRFDPAAAEQAQQESLLPIASNLNDCVQFVIFLCGGAMQGVTGQIFHIDSRLI
jgi:3-oxoacyl-[acyl-carrier protein] reductase